MVLKLVQEVYIRLVLDWYTSKTGTLVHIYKYNTDK